MRVAAAALGRAEEPQRAVDGSERTGAASGIRNSSADT